MSAIPRIVIAAPSPGHGKTTVAVGLLAALRGRGLGTAAFTMGPDQLAAGYLGQAAGRTARNLDPVLAGPHRMVPLFLHGARGADIAVINGTLGLYDGLAGRSTASTAALAGTLRAPVLLVLDAAMMGRSVAALVQGFRRYDDRLWLAGVLLNRVASARHEQLLRDALAEIGVPVLGALPRSGAGVPPGHLAVGLDLDGILAVARAAPDLPEPAWSPGPALGLSGEDAESTADLFGPGLATALPAVGPAVGRVEAGLALGPLGRRPMVFGVGDDDGRPVIAVAAGPGGPYGYPEMVELLGAAGARLVPVDPLRDERLPAGTRGLVLGGGLPEAQLAAIAGNTGLLRAIAELAATGAPILAEGAGLAILAQRHDGRPMAGVLGTATQTGERTVRGYRSAAVRSVSPLLPIGSTVTGYKRHRVLARPRAGAQPAYLWQGGAPEGFVHGAVFASQLCPHWAGVPHLARRFVAAARSGSMRMRVAS